MAETITMNRIYSELWAIKREVDFIKTHMFDPDTIMTTEEAERFERALDELERGETTSLEDLKKELRL